jgi:hypothetical protein
MIISSMMELNYLLQVENVRNVFGLEKNIILPPIMG